MTRLGSSIKSCITSLNEVKKVKLITEMFFTIISIKPVTEPNNIKTTIIVNCIVKLYFHIFLVKINITSIENVCQPCHKQPTPYV